MTFWGRLETIYHTGIIYCQLAIWLLLGRVWIPFCPLSRAFPESLRLSVFKLESTHGREVDLYLPAKESLKKNLDNFAGIVSVCKSGFVLSPVFNYFLEEESFDADNHERLMFA